MNYTCFIYNNDSGIKLIEAKDANNWGKGREVLRIDALTLCSKTKY